MCVYILEFSCDCFSVFYSEMYQNNILKKIFLTSAYQNNLKTSKNVNLKKKHKKNLNTEKSSLVLFNRIYEI